MRAEMTSCATSSASIEGCIRGLRRKQRRSCWRVWSICSRSISRRTRIRICWSRALPATRINCLRRRCVRKPGRWSSPLSCRHSKQQQPGTRNSQALSERPAIAVRLCPLPITGAWRACLWQLTRSSGGPSIRRLRRSRSTSKESLVMKTCWTWLQHRPYCTVEQFTLSNRLRCRPRHRLLQCFAMHLSNVEKEIIMSASILVAYATRYGSTQEVAEAIAATLRERGLAVDIQPMRDVRSLDQYRAVVLGAPLYMFHWHKDAIHFLVK